MHKTVLILSIILFTALPGCGNLSPRQEQKIDNTDGKIGNLENLANSMKAEIGKVQTQNEIQDSKIGQMQQGLANYQSNYENTGVQILSGPGGIIVSILAITSAVILILHYRRIAKIQEKTANIMAERIISFKDPHLEDSVFSAAMYTDVEENVLNLMKRHKS